VLQDLGIEHVFGLPGTQNMALFEALRASSVRVVVPMHELSAGFMAHGYFQVCGRVAPVLTIHGPGFAYTLPAMAEAALDSIALLQLTTMPGFDPVRRYLSQAIDQRSMVAPVSKGMFEIHRAAELTPGLREAFDCATGGEPGPVLIQIDPHCLDEEAAWEGPTRSPVESAEPIELEELSRELAVARRPLIFVGQGAQGAAMHLGQVAERLGAAVLSTSSGRGIIPESHPLSLGFEFSGTRTAALNELVEQSDRVLAIGCRFSQNGARGFHLQLPEEKLIHVDRSAAVLGANYPARWKLRSDAGEFCLALLEQLGSGLPSTWSAEELDDWRRRGLQESWIEVPEPLLLGQHPSVFFDALRSVLAEDSHLVTDSGLHQLLARRYFRVERPAGLVMPADFQSMGFGLPAAIGAQLARPRSTVAALIGDGGLLMTAMDLLTAVELGIDLRVLVVKDGSFGLIRRSQESAYGAAPSSVLPPLDYAQLAASLGANYLRLGPIPAEGLREAFAMAGVTLVEVPAGDSPGLRVARAKGRVKRALDPRFLRRVRQLMGR
jgi:acetolactate synthase-1/2/3 large subunit